MTLKMLFLVMALLPVVGGAAVLLSRDGDALGRLATAKLPGETVSYAYNVRNALTSITSPHFSQRLYYGDGGYPCYNSNIGMSGIGEGIHLQLRQRQPPCLSSLYGTG